MLEVEHPAAKVIHGCKIWRKKFMFWLLLCVYLCFAIDF
jgi:hypothetical protein